MHTSIHMDTMLENTGIHFDVLHNFAEYYWSGKLPSKISEGESLTVSFCKENVKELKNV